MQLKDLQNKIAHFNFNLDYPIDGVSLDTQTNALISKALNNFYNLYKDNIQQYYIVYEYRDDCISFVGLRLLQILAEQMNFNFEIYGKVKKFKKKVGNARRVNEKEINKKSNVLLISNFNPIYKVNQIEELSKKIKYNQKYNIVEQFTPDELSIAFNFYGGEIEEISYEDPIRSLKTLRFNKWIKNLQGATLPTEYMVELSHLKPIEVNIVSLTNDINKNKEILQQVEQSDRINFYYTGTTNNDNLLYKTFSNYVKNKSNIPNEKYLNINVNMGSITEYIKKFYFGEAPADQFIYNMEDN